MPNYKIVEVIDRQSIWDMGIQEYGSAEGAFQLFQDNRDQLFSMASMVMPTMLVKIKSAPVDKETLSYFQRNNLHPVSIGKEIKEHAGGDYNDDYNEDYF